ncbi:MAG: hypothetical protein ACLUGJ_17695 [Blautia wexlerae]
MAHARWWRYCNSSKIRNRQKQRRSEGIDFETEVKNELLRVPFDFCNPTIKVGIEKVPCVDEKGRKNPQKFFPRARIRFIRYEGTEKKNLETEMNVIKDVIFEGTLLNMINEAIAYLRIRR